MIISSFDDMIINTNGIEESQDLNQFPNVRERTIAYFIDQNYKLFEWISDKKNIISQIDMNLSKEAKLLAIHPNNLFFALQDNGKLLIIQTFDKQVVSQISHELKIDKFFFDLEKMNCFVFDSQQQMTIYSQNTQQKIMQKKICQIDSVQSLTYCYTNQMIYFFNSQNSTLVQLSSQDFEQKLVIDINQQIERYTENNNQSNFIIKNVYQIMYLAQDDTIILSTQSQIIMISQYYETIVKIIYLERVTNKSLFFTLKSTLYQASFTQYAKELNIYKIIEFEGVQSEIGGQQYNNFIADMKELSEKDELERNNDEEDEEVDDNVDIINEFAKQYENNPTPQFNQQIEEQKKDAFSVIDEQEYEDEEENQDQFQQSFKNTTIYTDIAKQIEQSARGGVNDNEGLSCLNSFVAHPKSLFVLANQKIDNESIYDHSDNYNKTRFSSNLPQKFSKANLPVTFHKKIKSSGYSGQPSSMKYSKSQKQKAQQPQSQYAVTRNFYAKTLPMTIPEELKILAEQPLHKNATVRLAYSPFGTKLACISQDTTISVLKTPMFQNKLDLTSLGGHNGPVNSIHFSANDQYLISASADKSCIIWNMKWSKKGEKLLILDRLKKNKTSSENPQNQALLQQQNPPFTDAIRGAQFYYDDKLLTISTGNQLLFYQYELPDNPDSSTSKDDVKRLQQKGLYKLIQTYQHPSAQNIPSFHFHNHKLKTNIGLIGGSNKELIVYDANYNKAIATMNDGHQKHIHTVKFYEGTYGDQEAYNTFLTASTDNFIKLWDLRVGQPVREYGGYHQNRAIQIGFSISNCFRYLISGSEDRSVYIYDIGSGELLDRTKNSQHTDSVTDVAVNPVYYEWATSCIDGHVRIFRYPAHKVAQKPKPKNGGGGIQVKGKKAVISSAQQQSMREYD